MVANGAMAGRLDVTGSAAGSTMQLIGNLRGSLLAGTFGNVTIVGKRDDQPPGDPTVFAGNAGAGTLQITTKGGTGSVNRADAFARYIGYP